MSREGKGKAAVTSTVSVLEGLLVQTAFEASPAVCSWAVGLCLPLPLETAPSGQAARAR